MPFTHIAPFDPTYFRWICSCIKKVLSAMFIQNYSALKIDAGLHFRKSKTDTASGQTS